MKYLFIARGPGETGQAIALANYIEKKGGEILFGLHQRENLHFFEKDKKFKIFITKTPIQLKKIIKKEGPKVILFFNSKMWARYPEFYKNPPFSKTSLSLGIDSNWLFNNQKYPHYKFIEWLDNYLVLFPKKIFELGLKEKGGDFKIPKEILRKIIPVGFIPSYQKPKKEVLKEIRENYQIKEGEKFIFSYFSGFGAGHRIWAFNNFVEAVDRLIKRKKKIKAIYVGPTFDLNKKRLKKDWLILREKLLGNDYFLTLASADLVFQHQGMVTLSQAISARIPVIANVSILKDESLPFLHFWEINPFKRVEVCEVFSKSSPVEKISQKIEELLYNEKAIKKMKENQALIFEKGEEKAFKIIKKLIL